jgi:tripartite-type tricarboxylate transporter receptor subunit TctC
MPIVGGASVKLPRRRFLSLAAGAAALPNLPGIAAALDYPSRPVRLVTGFSAGGPSDILARLIGPWLSQRLGQTFVVENRPGAASNVATETALRGAADGYTLLILTPANTINATLYDKLNFNFVADAAPVAGLIRVPQVLEVHPSVPVQTVPEFIAYAKAHPGRLNMASAGSGTVQHVAGELFKFMTGVDMLHVPYRGQSSAILDMLSGRDQVMFDTAPNSLQYLKAGALRALAVTTATRFEGLPDAPVVADFVPGYESSAIYGVVSPKGTPSEIVATLNSEINAALDDPLMKERLTELGGTVLTGTPSEFGKLIADETEKWNKVIRLANIKPD